MLTNWPRLYVDDGGLWRRDRYIRLADHALNPAAATDLTTGLSTDENRIEILWINPFFLIVSVITKRWGWEDDLYFYNYRMLPAVEETLGDVDKVQAQPKRMWLPWRFPNFPSKLQ